MSSLVDDITYELEDKFGRHPVWVWYDQSENYSGIIDEIDAGLDDVTVAKYDGSYLELKHRFYTEDPDTEGKWLFYITESKTDSEWFRDIDALAHEYSVDEDVEDTPVTEFLVEHDDDIPDIYENWGQNREHRQNAFFCVLFDTEAPALDEWLLSYLRAPNEYRETIADVSMDDAWDARLQEEYGVDGGLDADAIAEQLLFGEVEANAPTNRYQELAADDPRRAAAFCRKWQRRRPDDFTAYSRRIAREYDLARAVTESGDISWEATAFEGIDKGLIELVMSRLASTTFADLPAVASTLQRRVESRAESFWSQQEIVDWSIPKTAVDVLAEIEAADSDDAVEASSQADLAADYTTDDGWWQVDAAYRTYITASRESNYPVPEDSAVNDRVTRHYMNFLGEINRPFAEALADEPAFGTPQTSFFEEYATPEEGTAILICDGLRYELAEAIQSRLDRQPDFEQELAYVSSALPSITEVGMAAHLPGDLRLSLDDDDDLQVDVDKTTIRSKSDRVEKLNDAGYEVTSLSDVVNAPIEALAKEEPIPRVVYSGVVDKLGEALDDDAAFSQVAGHVDDVEGAIQRLKQAGYTKFIVTSDHGFLYTDRLSDDLKLEAPKDVQLIKRRFAATDWGGAADTDGAYITLDGEDLKQMGINANLKLLFPRSVACFKARGGNMQYFHGGISLQEMIVPCLTVATETPSKEASISYSVNIPDPITNSIVPIEIKASSSTLSFDEAPTLEVRATIDGDSAADPLQMEIEPGVNSESIQLKQGAIAGAERVTFTIVDTDTRETMENRTVELDLLFGDDTGFDI